MNLTHSLFGKDIYELTLSDIEKYFENPQEENSKLEFKSGDVQLEGIYKEVAAFLNTDGGVLIVGAPREINKICKGELNPSKTILHQDTLVRSISGNISPSPIGIKVQTLEKDNGNVFIIEVPQSSNAPHQVSNEGKYYIRLERDAKPAPHGIVEALFNQRRRSRVTAKAGVIVKSDPLKASIFIFMENESVIHATSNGLLLTISGVKKLLNQSNFQNSLQIRDDLISNQEIRQTPLVKGMKYTFQVDLVLRHPFFYFSVGFYSHDAGVETIQLLYDTSTNKYLSKQYSQEPASFDNIGTENGFSQYQEMKREKLAQMLLIPFGGEPDTVSIEKAYSLALEMQIEFPESYIDFFAITNGFNQFKWSKKIQLLSVEALTDVYHSPAIKDFQDILVIGFIDELPVYLDFENRSNSIFRWTTFKSNDHVGDEQESTSFYDLVESLAK